MSEKTGIPLSTYQRIEQLGEGSMRDFAKILVALNRANEINNILNKNFFIIYNVYNAFSQLIVVY